eukprot:1117758-Rhodomonas_salina.4
MPEYAYPGYRAPGVFSGTRCWCQGREVLTEVLALLDSGSATLKLRNSSFLARLAMHLSEVATRPATEWQRAARSWQRWLPFLSWPQRLRQLPQRTRTRFGARVRVAFLLVRELQRLL